MELYEALQNGASRQKLIDDFIAQLHEAEERVERENKAKVEAEEKAKKAKKEKDEAELKAAYEAFKTASNKYWTVYKKVHPEDTWLVELMDSLLNKNTPTKNPNTYHVKYPTQNDDEVIRKFIDSL